jgi:hypothetical protein
LIIFLTIPLPAFAYNVGDACTTAGKNYFSTPQGPGAPALICNGATLEVFLGTAVSPTRVGVVTDTPATTLDVNGEVKVGNTSLACSATIAGAIRYSAVNACMELCNGTSWLCTAASCDNSPTPPVFTQQTNLSLTTLTLSNIVLVTGMTAGCNALVGVSGAGSPQYRVCSDAACATVVQTWGTANVSLDIQGKYIQLEATSSGTAATNTTVTAAIGPITSDWTLSTLMSACSTTAGTVCADGTIYAGTSSAGTPMYTTRCDAGQTWSGAACTGARAALSWNNGNTTGYVTTGFMGANGKANTAGIVLLDSDSVTAGTQPHVAAQYCVSLSEDGYSDWYLPALAELNTLYTNRVAIANFDVSGNVYWTSTEYSSNGAWFERFSDGNQSGFNINKYYTCGVRCVRR